MDPADLGDRTDRNWTVTVDADPRLERVADSDAAPIRVGVNGEVVELAPGSMREFPLEPAEPSYSG
jgi:hypothetical protein